MRLIDADAVKESIKKQLDILRLIGNDELIQYANIIQRGFIQEIDNAPTIEPEPSQVARNIATIIENEQDMRVIARERMKGKWIRNDNGTYSCSLCQSWIPEEQHCYARYCLYCGADMQGEE